MARPTKWRRVAAIPEVTYFKPAGIPLRVLEEVELTVEEVEAIRLRDMEGLQQEECAQRMHISRPTFHRVLRAARRKIADALISGKAMRIEGGKFALSSQLFRCRRDGHEWRVPFETMTSGRPLTCPRCNNSGVLPIQTAASAGRGHRPGGRTGGCDVDWEQGRSRRRQAGRSW